MSRKMPAAEAVGEITAEQLEAELRRERYKRSFAFTLRNTIYMLITVAAVAVLVAVLLMPVLQIYGTSMAPTLEEGEIVLSVKGSEFKTGDVMAFYYNNNILVKRVIAQPGDWVDITEDGTVYVNNVMLDEPYLIDKPTAKRTSSSPTRCPSRGSSCWETTGAYRSTRGTRRWAA